MLVLHNMYPKRVSTYNCAKSSFTIPYSLCQSLLLPHQVAPILQDPDACDRADPEAQLPAYHSPLVVESAGNELFECAEDL